MSQCLKAFCQDLHTDPISLTPFPSPAKTYRYGYDYRMRRVSRDESSAGGESTVCSFSGGTCAFEKVASAVRVEYVRGSDYGGGIGGILYSVRGGANSFNAYNSRGDVVAKTNSGGGVTWEATYEAFGTRTTESGTNPDRQKANTKEEDPTGLLNEGFRYRDLETGMFISRDPMGFVDGPNVYSYVQQNPWTKFDPDGLFWSAAINIGFAAWDTYQVATGGISKTEYAGRMALTGAALVADAATGGMGGGMAVRAASVAARAGKAGQMAVKAATAVDRANTAYETGSALVENGAALAEARSEGDTRGMVKAAAGMALEMAVGKKADGALGVASQRKIQENAGDAVKSVETSGVYEIRGVLDGVPTGYSGSSFDPKRRLTDPRHIKAQTLMNEGTDVSVVVRSVDISDAANKSEAQRILRTNEQLSQDEMKAEGLTMLNSIRARSEKKMEQNLNEYGDRRQ